MNDIKRLVYSIFPKVYEFFSGNSIFTYKFYIVPIDSYLHHTSKVYNSKFISIGKNVTIEKDNWLNVISQKKVHGKIFIEDGTKIGQRCTLSSANEIRIGKYVLLGLNVYISDHEHQYKDIFKPIMFQGTVGKGKITIRKGAWIGNNVVIIGRKDLFIGKNSIIGANSIVKNNVPDYTVVAGNPAKIIKKYNFSKKAWISK